MSEDPPVWRLLIDPPQDGAWNMAVDEAILEAAASASEPVLPTVRLYAWAPAALSLGRFQQAAGAHDPAYLAAEGIDLVRRPTGGDAVLHEDERTFAVVGATRSEFFPGGVADTYDRIRRAIARALEALGIATDPPVAFADRRARRGPVCFDRLGAHEIGAGGRKLVGAAQARRARAFLQHGSIPRALDPEHLSRATGASVDAARLTDLTRRLGGDPGTADIDRAIVRGFAECFGVRLEQRALSASESLRAAELRCWKYDSMAWTRHGRIGEREARWGRP
ncbi:MAG TPA: biotin/lipoate A/B protein ligase family protein [Candidatus Sulfotelmatobacter sp.]|nr:biotin/lipoate A/B protein ligase family protein [Candidatus Sulfotelmatobacter sp.]